MKQERADNINELKAELEILEESLVEAKQNLELITNEYNTILEDGKQLKAKSDINFEHEEIKVNRAVKSLKITILKNGDKIKKDFADLKKKELQSTTKHKQIAQVQIKRIMARTPNIKDPLKYEQKLTQKYLQGTLNFDKDLQIVNQELNKKIFDSI